MNRVAPAESREPKPQTGEQPQPQKVEDLKLRMSQAMEKKEGRDSLHRAGDFLYENFKGADYPHDMVLSSIKEVYDERQAGFDPKLGFREFIKSFGPGLIKLCQLKLLAAGGFDLGKFGKHRDGVDGKLGRMTGGALDRYFMGEQTLPPEKPPVASDRPPRSVRSTPAPRPAVRRAVTPPSRTPVRPADKRPAPATERATARDSVRTPAPVPESRAEKGKISPKSAFERRMLDIYDSTPNTYRTDDLPKYFGRTRKEIEPYIINEDPVTHKPITFLERPIANPHAKGKKGINMEFLIFLKIAEEKLEQRGIKYQPRASEILGFEFRGMKVQGKETKTLSSHAFGMAIDIDPNLNGPKQGRGTIPDEVAMIMVESGMAWGYIQSKDYRMLGADPMHFQPRFPADSEAGQAIINASPAGRKYWAAIRPMLDEIKGSRA